MSAHLRPYETDCPEPGCRECDVPGCRRVAVVAAIHAEGIECGRYCRRHGKAKLAQMQADERALVTDAEGEAHP